MGIMLAYIWGSLTMMFSGMLTCAWRITMRSKGPLTLLLYSLSLLPSECDVDGLALGSFLLHLLFIGAPAMLLMLAVASAVQCCIQRRKKRVQLRREAMMEFARGQEETPAPQATPTPQPPPNSVTVVQ